MRNIRIGDCFRYYPPGEDGYIVGLITNIIQVFGEEQYYYKLLLDENIIDYGERYFIKDSNMYNNLNIIDSDIAMVECI